MGKLGVHSMCRLPQTLERSERSWHLHVLNCTGQTTCRTGRMPSDCPTGLLWARAGRPDAALLGVLARHPRLPWAAALLQPSAEQLPELLRALLAPQEEGAGRVPGATPPAPAAAAGAADAGAAPAEPVGEIWKCMRET